MEYQLKPGVLSRTEGWLRRVAPARNESAQGNHPSERKLTLVCVHPVISTDAEYKKESASLKLKVLELQRPDMNDIACHHNLPTTRLDPAFWAEAI